MIQRTLISPKGALEYAIAVSATLPPFYCCTAPPFYSAPQARVRLRDTNHTFLIIFFQLGFRPEVENFQPYYRFHDRYLNDLRIGAAVIKEMMQVEGEKQEREEHKREAIKAEEAARVEKVRPSPSLGHGISSVMGSGADLGHDFLSTIQAKKAFLDDRKSTMMRAQRESEKRRRQQEQRPPPQPTSPRIEEDSDAE